MPSAVTRWSKLVIGLAITAVFLWLLARGLDVEALRGAFSRLSAPYLALSLTFLAAGYFLRIVRWWWMLRTLEPSLDLKACAWPFLTSIAVNNVMPFRAGDAFRVFGFRKQLRSPGMRVLGTLVVERVLDVVVILGFFFFGLLGLPAGAIPEQFVSLATWLAGFSLAAVLAVILFTPWLNRLIHRISAHSFFARRDWSQAVADHGMHFTDALGLLRAPARLFGLLGLSVVAWSFEGAVFATVAAALNSIADTMGPWFSLATGTLATLLPSSPGYIGTFDYFAAQGLAAYGAGKEVSVAFALTTHAVLWVPLTAAGLLYLILRGKRFWGNKASPTHVLNSDEQR